MKRKQIVEQNKQDRRDKKARRKEERQGQAWGSQNDAALTGSGQTAESLPRTEPPAPLEQSAVVPEIRTEAYYRKVFDRAGRGKGWWDEVLVYGLSDIASVKDDDIIFIDPNDAIRDRRQPRQFFNQAELWDLALCIFMYQQQETAQICRNPDKSDTSHPWVVLNGERRWRATTMALLPYKAQVVPYPSCDLDRLKAQVLSNENRVGLSDLEIAWNISELRELGMSVTDITLLYGKSDAWVYQHLAILKLASEVQLLLSPEAPKDQQLSLNMALKIKDVPVERQLEVAREIAGKSAVQSIEIIRGAIGESQLMIGNRKRRGSDDLSELRNSLIRQVERLGLVQEYSDERFGRMFLNLTPANWVETANLILRVAKGSMAIRNRMLQYVPKGVKLKSQQPEEAKPKSEITALTEAKPESDNHPRSQILEGSVLDILEQIEAFAQEQADVAAKNYRGKPLPELAEVLGKAEEASHGLARFRLKLKQLGAPESTKNSPQDHLANSSAPPLSRQQVIKSNNGAEKVEIMKHLAHLRGLIVKDDDEFAKLFGQQPRESLAALSGELMQARDDISKMLYACNRASHGKF